MINTILYATDLGIYAPHILQHVLSLAATHTARVVVVHAVEPLGLMADVVVKTYMPKDTKRELEKEGMQRIMRSIKGSIVDAFEDEYIDGNRDLACIRDVRVVCGKPADVILDQAVATGADLIVMGSHGHNAVTPALLGSVTAKVLQLAKVPVYMVPLMKTMELRSKAS